MTMEDTRERELVIVSGASSGIGLAMVKALLEAGYGVLGLCRHFDDPIVSHPDLRIHKLDFAEYETLPARLTELVEGIEEPVRALVNNAGIGKMGFLEQLSYHDLRVTMEVNFLSHAMLTRALMPHFKKQQSGDIVFIGSEAALHGARQGSIYCASKFALRGFAQALRQECGKAGIRVCIINPGATRTAFFDDLHYQPGQAPEHAILPEDIARVLLEVLSTRRETVIEEINIAPMTQVWERKR